MWCHFKTCIEKHINSTILAAGFRKKNTNTIVQFTRKLSWKLLVQRWNFDQNIGGEADRLVYFPQCKVNSKLDFRLKEDKVSRVIKKPNFQMRVGETSRDIFISKLVCEVIRIAPVSWFSLFFWKILAQIASMFHYYSICNSVIFAREVARYSLSKHYFTDQPFMNETW